VGRRLVRSPLLHFVLLGLVLLAVERALRDPLPPPPVYLSASELETLEREWTRRTGVAPTREVRDRLIRQRVDEELLLREAYARRWDRTDPVVVRRLVTNQRFLDPDSPAGDETLLALAYEQGMERRDEIVRRRLLERVRLAVAASARRTEPDEEELRAVLEASPEDYAIPARIRLVQLYLSRERRGAAVERDARMLLARLRAEDTPPEQALAHADPFLHPAAIGPATETSVASRLGPDFARAVFEAPVGRWVGPIASSYGQHLVWIEDRVEGRPGTVDDQRDRLRTAAYRLREERALRDLVAQLRKGVVVRVEGCAECGTGGR